MESPPSRKTRQHLMGLGDYTPFLRARWACCWDTLSFDMGPTRRGIVGGIDPRLPVFLEFTGVKVRCVEGREGKLSHYRWCHPGKTGLKETAKANELWPNPVAGVWATAKGFSVGVVRSSQHAAGHSNCYCLPAGHYSTELTVLAFHSCLIGFW